MRAQTYIMPTMSKAVLFGFGVLLIAAFFGLSETEVGLRVAFTPGWTNSVPQELYFWLGSAFLLLPGGVLIASSISGPLSRFGSNAAEKFGQLEPSERRGIAFLVFALGVIVATLLNQLVFLGYPITDDEFAIQYGGRLLAMGQLSEPVPSYFDIIPHHYFYVRDGMMTSFDFLGGQLAWALSELTLTGTSVFALMAGVGMLGVYLIVAARASTAWALIASLFFLISPMALFLSGTSHAHVVSRGWLALSFALYLHAAHKGSVGGWIAAGLVTGAAWITRPAEVSMLWAPLGLMMVWDAARGARSERVALVGFLGGLALPIVLFFAHSLAVTGTLLPARLAPNELPSITDHHKAPFAFLAEPSLLWTRFGANVSYNTMMLAISALGPLGVLLVSAGAGVDRFTRCLAAGLICALLLALMHDDYGLHLVGPIHYSEAIVPIVVLAVLGLRRICHRVEQYKFDYRKPLAATIVGLVIALTVSNVWYLVALHRQAEIHDTVYGHFDDPKFDNSVILGPNYASVWWPQFSDTKTFVFSWRPIHPAGTDRVIFAELKPDRPELIDAFVAGYPERNFFVLGVAQEAPYFHVAPLE